MPLRVYDLQIDEWNEAEAARHSVTAAEIRQALDDDPVFLLNKKAHAAPMIMIGYTSGGRLLTVPLAATSQQDIWRPATAWDSSQYERARYKAVRGG